MNDYLMKEWLSKGKTLDEDEVLVQGSREVYATKIHKSPTALTISELRAVLLTTDGKGTVYKEKCLHEYARRSNQV